MNIKELRTKINLSQQDLSDKTGIPKGRIAQWEVGKAKPKVEDQETLINFFIENGVMERTGTLNDAELYRATIQNLSESNRLVAEAIKLQSEAVKIQAESSRLLAISNSQLLESNRELTALSKMTTGSSGPEIPAAVAAKFEDLLAAVAEIVGGQHNYKSRNEAFAEIHRLFYDTGKGTQHEGTRVGGGTRRIEKSNS